jgi:hypothetical protein
MSEEFEPRRAEPGQEFSYTTTKDVTLAEGDDVPEGAEIVSVEDDDDGVRTRVARQYGIERTIKADADGVVHPKTAADKAILDGFSLPVARSAIAESKAAEKTSTKSTKTEG